MKPINPSVSLGNSRTPHTPANSTTAFSLACIVAYFRCVRLCPSRRSQCATSPLSLLHADGVCDNPMGQTIAKRALVTKHASIYDTSVWARKYRHDFEALQLSEEQVRLMWDEYCKVSAGVNEEKLLQWTSAAIAAVQVSCQRYNNTPYLIPGPGTSFFVLLVPGTP